MTKNKIKINSKLQSAIGRIKKSRYFVLGFGSWKFRFGNEDGLGIVEIIVVISILLTAFVAILQTAVLENKAQTLSRQTIAAYLLARESVEATRSIRDSDWANIQALAYDVPYYPQVNVSNEWELSVSDPGPIGTHTRWIEVSEVFRDGNDDIALTGTADDDTRKITAYVSWTRAGGDMRTITIEAYITNWQGY